MLLEGNVNKVASLPNACGLGRWIPYCFLFHSSLQPHSRLFVGPINSVPINHNPQLVFSVMLLDFSFSFGGSTWLIMYLIYLIVLYLCSSGSLTIVASLFWIETRNNYDMICASSYNIISTGILQYTHFTLSYVASYQATGLSYCFWKGTEIIDHHDLITYKESSWHGHYCCLQPNSNGKPDCIIKENLHDY